MPSGRFQARYRVGSVDHRTETERLASFAADAGLYEQAAALLTFTDANLRPHRIKNGTSRGSKRASTEPSPTSPTARP